MKKKELARLEAATDGGGQPAVIKRPASFKRPAAAIPAADRSARKVPKEDAVEVSFELPPIPEDLSDVCPPRS